MVQACPEGDIDSRAWKNIKGHAGQPIPFVAGEAKTQEEESPVGAEGEVVGERVRSRSPERSPSNLRAGRSMKGHTDPHKQQGACSPGFYHLQGGTARASAAPGVLQTLSLARLSPDRTAWCDLE